ncbi:metal ABC transporter ATP-binding protein [Dethiosulfatarculus sandiegensis]|uniref:Zinc ABC transporter ATP-binding protein n=1 Tax=Dethiosulfatarculus sandiegensis TaxID=1429043 RepID=A0A0D2J6W1_9BACT|nr:metal ABC transporter ATP-binding protein [Dethiosulfatarculus sandiegensis]KIX11416.1 zinc ABC transporter ATP-binding protein [Dethiosulfatarculus sandiegensis]
MSEPVIEIKNLYYSYGRGQVLNGVSLTVEQGDYVAFLGPNGGGKSTLLKIMAGVIAPDRGSVRVLGRKMPGTPKGVGYVPQEITNGTGLPVTVEEVVLMGRLTAGFKFFGWGKKDRAAAAQALEWVGMGAYLKEQVDKLSGGQRQRVFIARALVDNPSLLLLDEPTSSVDRTWQGRFYDLLAELNESMTIVLVSHDLNVISTHVKSVACVNHTVFHHHSAEITPEMMQKTYNCPVELVAHGMPHRVLALHNHQEEDEDA